MSYFFICSFYGNVLLFEFDLLWMLNLKNKSFTLVLFLITNFNWQIQFDSFMNSAFSYQKCLMKSLLFFRDTKSSQYFVKKDQKLWHNYWNIRIKSDFSADYLFICLHIFAKTSIVLENFEICIFLISSCQCSTILSQKV